MKPISTKTHAMLDYLTVGAFLALPRLMGSSREFTNAVTCGALGKLGYTLLTRHEGGVVKVIPMTAHLWLDAVMGAGLMAMPHFFDESCAARRAFEALGAFDILAAPLTQTSHEPPHRSHVQRRWLGAGSVVPVDAPSAGDHGGSQLQIAGR